MKQLKKYCILFTTTLAWAAHMVKQYQSNRQLTGLITTRWQHYQTAAAAVGLQCSSVSFLKATCLAVGVCETSMQRTHNSIAKAIACCRTQVSQSVTRQSDLAAFALASTSGSVAFLHSSLELGRHGVAQWQQSTLYLTAYLCWHSMLRVATHEFSESHFIITSTAGSDQLSPAQLWLIHHTKFCCVNRRMLSCMRNHVWGGPAILSVTYRATPCLSSTRRWWQDFCTTAHSGLIVSCQKRKLLVPPCYIVALAVCVRLMSAAEIAVASSLSAAGGEDYQTAAAAFTLQCSSVSFASSCPLLQ
eukprot:9698-Heterococcus_DN1.PRE.3